MFNRKVREALTIEVKAIEDCHLLIADKVGTDIINSFLIDTIIKDKISLFGAFDVLTKVADIRGLETYELISVDKLTYTALICDYFNIATYNISDSIVKELIIERSKYVETN